MNITYYGQGTFGIEGEKASVIFNPTKETPDGFTMACDNTPKAGALESKSKKTFTLPGEYEMSEVLVKGVYTHKGDKSTNTAYKVTMDEIAVVHFGHLIDMPVAAMYEKLGETVDIAFVIVGDQFNVKKAKELVDTVTPRVVVLGGEGEMLEKAKKEMTAVIKENPFTYKRGTFKEDEMAVIFLGE